MTNFAQLGQKMKDFSESVNSFESGSIFLPSLKKKLPNGVVVASILFSERISHGRTDFCMTPKIGRNLVEE